MPWVDSATHDQRLAGLPNPIAFIWDEVHPPQGPPGWDPVQYWAWEDVRLLLTFIPARMKSAPDRAVDISIFGRRKGPGTLKGVNYG